MRRRQVNVFSHVGASLLAGAFWENNEWSWLARKLRVHPKAGGSRASPTNRMFDDTYHNWHAGLEDFQANRAQVRVRGETHL